MGGYLFSTLGYVLLNYAKFCSSCELMLTFRNMNSMLPKF